MRSATYVQGASGPPLKFWWPDPDSDGPADLSAYTVTVEVGDRHKTSVFSKASGIVVQAGSGTEKAGDPNVVVTWADSGEISDLAPGEYSIELTATKAGEVRKQVVMLRIGDGLTA